MKVTKSEFEILLDGLIRGERAVIQLASMGASLDINPITIAHKLLVNTSEIVTPEDKPETCQGSHCSHRGLPKPLHTCPFKTEMSDDDTTLCNCCEQCTHECAMDV